MPHRIEPLAAAPRRLEPDLLKAIGIVAVVLIHSVRSPFTPGVSEVELWIGRVTRFAVPAFLLSSGFLYASRSPVPWPTTARRLRRILGPYLVASLAAQGFEWLRGTPRSVGQVLHDLLLASSFGPYYYVWIALVVVLLAPLLARAGPRALAAILLLTVASQWLLESALLGFAPFFWHLRNPLLWIGYFVCGWALRLHEAKLRGWLAAHRGAALASSAGAVVGLALAGAQALPLLQAQTLSWLGIYATLALLLAVSFGRRTESRILKELSEGSYAIYLFHLFFVLPARDATLPAAGAFEALAVLGPWAAGLAGPLLLIALARRTLGARSRALIGA
jgi:surface polysaccharide O-acyltransferase-like enzyme